ncbi:hypothetical protein E7Y35_04180 [Spiroplasma sp. SV19]|nr:hypothetical protein E7Y35_04180 [Spiroplasma sp. SV19]
MEIQLNMLNGNINYINEFMEENKDFMYEVTIADQKHKIYLKDIMDFKAKIILNLLKKKI